jgi:hypothetical protein
MLPASKAKFEVAVAKGAQSFIDSDVFASFHSRAELEAFASDLELELRAHDLYPEVRLRRSARATQARGVINGSHQGEVNGNDAYTVRSESARIIAAFAAQHGLLFKQLDFTTASLNTIIKNFVRMPDALLKFLGTPKHYAHLHKTVYGHKQASAEWYEHISKCTASLRSSRTRASSRLLLSSIIGISTDDIIVAIE